MTQPVSIGVIIVSDSTALEQRLLSVPAPNNIITNVKTCRVGEAAGCDVMAIQADLLEMFEAGVVDGKNVLEVTGEDIAAFCDELLRNERTYPEDWRGKLNSDIKKKLGK